MKWLADENFRNAIIRGLLRRTPLDIARAQDIPEVCGRDDSALLRFAAAENRIGITHDLSTMIPAMRLQMHSGDVRARVVFVPDSMPVYDAIEHLLLLDECTIEADWDAGVIYIPLR